MRCFLLNAIQRVSVTASRQIKAMRMTPEHSLKSNFQKLGFTAPANDWLCGLFNAAQVFDDIADNDDIKRLDLDRAIWFAFVGSQSNQFFTQNKDVLIPVVANFVLKWHASDSDELNKKADEQSYVWRAGYYDIVLMVYCIHFGEVAAAKNAAAILRLYGETYAEYKKEFNIA